MLFGLFGCGSFVLGAAVCCLAVLYTRGEDLLPQHLKLVLGLCLLRHGDRVFRYPAAGAVGLPDAGACYANGVKHGSSGGALAAVLGGSLLLLCGRPGGKLIMLVLALCVSLYIFDLTPGRGLGMAVRASRRVCTQRALPVRAARSPPR